MSVFILGGKAKGLEIPLPANINFRPTSVMLRRKIFDSKQLWEGHQFIDLCAGSGVMGFEALSRGASQIYLNDSSTQQFKMLKIIKDLWCKKFPEDFPHIHLSNLDVLKFSATIEVKNKTWFFFDPPYENEKLYLQFFHMILEKEIDSDSGVMIEFGMKKNVSIQWIEAMEKLRSKKRFRELQSSDRKVVIVQGE